MKMPSAGDMEKIYPVEDWSRDMDFWFSKGTLSPAEFPQVVYRRPAAHPIDKARHNRCVGTPQNGLASHHPNPRGRL